MTPKQAQRLIKRIADIKRVLAAEKRKFGGYDDSRGLRYLPTRYYLQLGDYRGGLAYTRWFSKTFPDDIGFPDFLFEWSVILFKAGKLAEAKVWQTFCANTYILDKFLGHPVEAIPKYEWSNWATPDFANQFRYTYEQADWLDFSHWLEEFISSELFQTSKARYLAIYQRLELEADAEIRGYLRQEAHQLGNTL